MPTTATMQVGSETLSYDLTTREWSGPDALVKRAEAVPEWTYAGAIEAQLPFGFGSAYREFRWVAFQLDATITKDVEFESVPGVVY